MKVNKGLRLREEPGGKKKEKNDTKAGKGKGQERRRRERLKKKKRERALKEGRLGKVKYVKEKVEW